jgi:hypothetical protein
MELARRALPLPGPAGRYEIHLAAHQLAAVDVADKRPRHLNHLAPLLVLHHAGGGRVAAVERRVTARGAGPRAVT